MATKAKQPTASAKPQPEPTPVEEPTQALALADDEDPTLEVELEPELEAEPETVPEPTPSGYQAPAEEPQDEPTPAPAAEPRPAETIILTGPASYGPVLIDGKATRCKKGVPYRVSDMAERVAILGTGYFRMASAKDVREAKVPSAGRGGAITKDLLPPGAIKGGLTQR